jgi:ketosteroid isomerase-like protein
MKRVLLMLAVGCGGSSKPSTTPTTTTTPEPVQQWEQAIFTAYEQANPAAFDGKVDPDGYFVASDPNEVWDGASFLATHHKMLGGVKPGTWKLASKDLHVVTASDGKSALFADTLDWDFGNGKPVTFRWTAVLANQSGKWVMSASHVSLGLPNQEAFMLANDNKLPPLKDIADKVDASAKDLVTVFDADLASPERWAKDISDRPDVYAFGSDPSETWQGGDNLKKAFISQIAQLHMSISRKGGVRARVIGEFGWVLTNIELKAQPEDGKQLVFPLRTLVVYAREGGGWKLVQAHFSNGVPN